jgi:hypothetical protein
VPLALDECALPAGDEVLAVLRMFRHTIPQEDQGVMVWIQRHRRHKQAHGTLDRCQFRRETRDGRDAQTGIGIVTLNGQIVNRRARPKETRQSDGEVRRAFRNLRSGTDTLTEFGLDHLMKFVGDPSDLVATVRRERNTPKAS